MRLTHRLLCLTLLCGLVAPVLAQAPPAGEDVARRQLESGRTFARQGNYVEALKDFRAVAETYGATSVADDAWLEIARYYLDVASDTKEAGAAVDAILKKYATSNSAPEAYVMAGRLAMGHSHLAPDLETALADFDRVIRLFPASDAVPRSLGLAGDAMWYGTRYGDALANFSRVEAEYPTSAAAEDAGLGASRALVALGDPIGAMEALQRVRTRAPSGAAATTALMRLTLLNRLYVRTRSGPAFALSAETAGPAKVENVLALASTRRNAVYWAGETTLGIVAPANADRPPAATRPRAVALDNTGALVVVDGGLLKLTGGGSIGLLVPRSNGAQETLAKVESVVQLSNGDWLVMDGGEKAIHRFTRAGGYGGPFATIRASRLAVNETDEVAALDREQKGIQLLDAAGKSLGKIPFKGTGYDLQNPEDLAYDAFGHLYVLDRGAVAVFSPYPSTPPAPGTIPAAAPAAPAGRASAYRLLTVFSEPEKNVTGFHKATAFTLDQSGALYLYDERAQRILVYR